MNLLNYIDISLSKIPSKISISLSKKLRLSQTALESYLKVNPCDLSHSVLSEFFFDFGKFLADPQGKNYTPSTIREVFRTLRKYVRFAIMEGHVPNIEVIPSVLERLDAEVWPDAIPDAKKAAYINRQELEVKSSVQKMLRYIETWSIREKTGIGSFKSDRDNRTQALENRCSAVYLFCILTYGMEIKDALAIKRDWEEGEIPDSVYVEKYGTRLTLSPAAKKLVKIYNKGLDGTGHLFTTLDNKKYGTELDHASKIIESHVKKYLARVGLPLYRQQSVFIDWLNYAIESGLPDQEAEALWKNHIAEVRTQDSIADASELMAKVEVDENHLGENWYLLCLIPFSVKRDVFEKMLLSSGILGEESEARKRIYVPDEKLVNKKTGEFVVFSRYIFFRGTPIQADFANRFSMYAYVLKDKIKSSYTKIREKEIKKLQVMLHDFPDAVELVDGQKWLEEHNARIVEGCKAIIRSGSLAGREAKVVEIKGKKNANPTFIIEFVEGAIKFQSSLEGVQLDIVKI